MNSKWKSAIAFLFIIGAFSYVSKEILFALFCGFSTDAPPPGSQIAMLFNRVQKVYWFENHRFGTEEDLIKEIPPLVFENHKYSIATIDNAAFHQSFVTISNADLCRKKESPLLLAIFNIDNNPNYTFSSAIFALSKSDFKEIVCKSTLPGWQRVNKPFLQDGEPVCGEGTTKYR